MDEKLEEDLYRENIKIAPIPARIGAYLIDMLVILLLMTVTLTQSQKDAINQAQITINTMERLAIFFLNLIFPPFVLILIL